MSRPTDQEARQRLVAFVQTVRTVLPLNPKKALSSFAAMVGCGEENGKHLLDLGVVSRDESGVQTFVSKETDSQIADKIIAHRRGEAKPKPIPPAFDPRVEETLKSLLGSLDKLEARVLAAEKVEQRLAALEQRLGTLDVDECKLAVQYDQEHVKRLDRLERAISTMALDHVSQSSPTPPSEAAPPQAPAPVEPPLPAKAKRKFGLLGAFERDVRFISERLSTKEKVRQNYEVTLVRIDHHIRPMVIPRGLDAVFVASDALKYYPEAKQIYQDLAIRVPGGGVSSMVEAISNHLTEFIR